MQLTPDKQETPLIHAARTLIFGNNQIDSVDSFRKRFFSLPNVGERNIILPGKLILNMSKSLDDIDYDLWERDTFPELSSHSSGTTSMTVGDVVDMGAKDETAAAEPART